MKLELKPHQPEEVEFSKDRVYFANFDDMWLGKSLTELARIHHLWKAGKITGVCGMCRRAVADPRAVTSFRS